MKGNLLNIHFFKVWSRDESDVWYQKGKPPMQCPKTCMF